MLKQVHAVTLLIVDHDDIGVDEITSVIESTQYVNHCIYPRVAATKTETVVWTDSHPINMIGKWRKEYFRLFGEEK